jgi:translation initiation factor 2B subunit (eIF-2B alpha/beta/delta family)
MIVLAARERDLPVYSLCDSSKFICRDYSGLANRDAPPAAELWPDAPPGIALTNRYFEPTPLAYFTGIITEDGVLTIEEAARRAGQASIENELVDALEVVCDQLKGPRGSSVPA